MKTYFITAVFLFALLGACHRKEAKPDKEYVQYQEYAKIYKAYPSVPLDSTKEALRHFLHLFPQDISALVFYGNVLFRQDSFDEAIRYYREAIKNNPRYSLSYSAIGAVYTRMNVPDSAEWYLLKSVEAKDSSAYTLLNLAFAYQKKGEIEKSITAADSSLTKKDAAADVFAGASYLMLKCGNKTKSESLFAKAVTLGLKDTTAFRLVLNGETKIEDYYKSNNY